MKIGIIVAMGKEMELLRHIIQDGAQEQSDGMSFLSGRIGVHDVVAMQCGIGKVNAAIGALTLINHYAPGLMINTGVAGGADPDVNVMDVVVGTRVAYHDVWCGPESVLGAVQGLPLYYEAPRPLLSLIPQQPNVKKGLICSGDQFIDTTEALDRIKGTFPEALAVDMESSAIAQVCCIRKVPFMSMRVISDSPGAGHNNTVQYNDFWQEAPSQTFELVRQLLSEPIEL